MADIKGFVSQYAPLAATVGQKIGVAPDVLLGQWGLETGWGKSVIPGTNNLGNIKDFSGSGVAATDNQTGSNDNYRAYADPSAFGADFAHLIASKYPGAVNAGTNATAYGQALAKGGYATDPKYVSKIDEAVGMVRKLGNFVANAISGTANAADLNSDPTWQLLSKAQPKASINASPPAAAQVDPSLASDPTFQLLSAPSKELPAASKNAAPAVSASANPGILDQLGRQIGLTARAAGHGVADFLGMVGDPLNGAINSLLGTQLPRLSSDIKAGVDAITPAPQNNLERVVQGVGSSIANPVNYIAGPIMEGAGGLLSLTGRGAVGGAVTGALQPSQPGDTPANMLARAAVGGVTGGVLGPLAGLAGSAASKLLSLVRPSGADEAAAQAAADRAIGNLSSSGIDLSQVPESTVNAVRNKVATAAASGKVLDPAAQLRALDFQALGMKPTLGQVTRNPLQFAEEQNLRGVDLGGGVNALGERFNAQPNQLRAALGDLGANAATDANTAGNSLISKLQAADQPAKAAVDSAYQAARDAQGRYAGIDVPAFSKAANDALDSQMLGRFLPEGARGLLNDVSSGKIPLDVNTAVQIDSVLSQAQRGAAARGDAAGAKAIGVVRTALNDAPISSDAGAAAKTAFDQARQMAAKRFATIEGSPALKAALEGASPDNFVSKYVIGADAQDLQNLSQLLTNDPQSRGLVRGQIASYLQSKAFGANTAGDKGFAQESFNRALNNMGDARLAAFFTPNEIEQFHRIGRVGAYIGSTPAGSAVNRSNTAGALMNMLLSIKAGALHIPIVGQLGMAGGAAVRAFGANRSVQNALAAKVAAQASESGVNPLLLLVGPESAQTSKELGH